MEGSSTSCPHMLEVGNYAYWKAQMKVYIKLIDEKEPKTTGEFYVKLCDLSTQAFALENEYSNTKLVRKKLAIDELISSLQTFEMNLDEAKQGRSKGDKNIVFQATEAVPTSSNVTTIGAF
ncbi:hypothetical protein Gotri_021399 [Gossypium trilobum]|uniref:Gag-pol polyprotein n=1 Tax=Gossypium trilobum TaxID=34281 RepID=A0A7J9DCS7_9ROSI|nr:hypothetical protein [Gossypium trilobum]